jgi:hypothetical protein
MRDLKDFARNLKLPFLDGEHAWKYTPSSEIVLEENGVDLTKIFAGNSQPQKKVLLLAYCGYPIEIRERYTFVRFCDKLTFVQKDFVVSKFCEIVKAYFDSFPVSKESEDSDKSEKKKSVQRM